jgi:methylmalonyl-CoA mutase, N-terminal domain
VERALARIEQVAHSDDNLMPAILDAVRVSATMGEICQRLEQVFGGYDPMLV